MSVVNILEKIDRIIMALHCIKQSKINFVKISFMSLRPSDANMRR